MILKSIWFCCCFIIDYILPPRCLSCAELTITAQGFCPDCWKKLNFIAKPYCYICGCQLNVSIFDNMSCGRCINTKSPYDWVRSLFIFDEHSSKIIHAFKYYDKTGMAKVLAKMLYYRYKSELVNIDLIVPVPMHKFKRLFRMYNQSYILAQELKIIINKPVDYRLLIKDKWTKSQTALSKKARIQNIHGSIKFNQKHCIKGKNILLVDDVLTTGSTIKECSRLLKSNGAQCVYAITIART
ncbi:Putative ComF family protein [Candidatus Trichorickettsia mobilis]|uniref:ComF family protein n=1 Tax=Candidatus Trichorickettsia mobilis TaxID=1346319 RepID=A0ABZ0UTX5_9RICK|nr:ComF family protein [Candidatus Trichorickettsia mobilis]WPY01251.1 Putative ComF family protein [Candidatus Trichorickettsia mobilis]